MDLRSQVKILEEEIQTMVKQEEALSKKRLILSNKRYELRKQIEKEESYDLSYECGYEEEPYDPPYGGQDEDGNDCCSSCGCSIRGGECSNCN